MACSASQQLRDTTEFNALRTLNSLYETLRTFVRLARPFCEKLTAYLALGGIIVKFGPTRPKFHPSLPPRPKRGDTPSKARRWEIVNEVMDAADEAAASIIQIGDGGAHIDHIAVLPWRVIEHIKGPVPGVNRARRGDDLRGIGAIGSGVQVPLDAEIGRAVHHGGEHGGIPGRSIEVEALVIGGTVERQWADSMVPDGEASLDLPLSALGGGDRKQTGNNQSDDGELSKLGHVEPSRDNRKWVWAGLRQLRRQPKVALLDIAQHAPALRRARRQTTLVMSRRHCPCALSVAASTVQRGQDRLL
jgi:hypothetical protein